MNVVNIFLEVILIFGVIVFGIFVFEIVYYIYLCIK